MLKQTMRCGFVAFLIVGLLAVPSVFGATDKPTVLKPCRQCHSPEEDVIRGKLKSISRKAKTMQIFVGSDTWQVVFNKNTTLGGAPAFNKIGKDREVAVTYRPQGNILVATDVEAKEAAEINEEWVIGVKEMAQLVAQGAKNGNFSLYDARPAPNYHEAHIEGAVSNYDATFNKNLAKLPKDKDRLVVFYCGGDT